jgi:hypothetical protein
MLLYSTSATRMSETIGSDVECLNGEKIADLTTTLNFVCLKVSSLCKTFPPEVGDPRRSMTP